MADEFQCVCVGEGGGKKVRINVGKSKVMVFNRKKVEVCDEYVHLVG